MLYYLKKIAPKNPWHYLWISIVFSEIFTALLSTIFSSIFWGRVSRDVLIIGAINALIVPSVVAPIIIYFIVAERKRVEKELRDLSLTDELTGLRNRRGFFILAEQELRLANRSKKGIFMLYADIDNFKWINDTFGHVEGDKVLMEVAHILKNNYRASDIIGRIGGDEFVIIPVGTSKDSVNIITERFHKILALHNKKEKRNYNISISVGIAYYDPESPCSLDDLLNKADRAMYEDKMRKKRT